jgi:predicted metal-dependent phosphoesterase TrpH
LSRESEAEARGRPGPGHLDAGHLDAGHLDAGQPAHARLGKADVHIHSIASDGTASAAAILDYVECHTDLDVMAIADHERIEAAVECQRLARERGSRVHVVVAEEVTTRSGHLLGVFLQARLRRNMRLETTVAEIHEQGGLAIVPHPFSAFTLGMRKHAILRVHWSRDPLVYWDALEGFNPSTAGRYGRAATARIARELGLPLVGNSDAHTLDTIGDGYTLFPGRTPEDYRAAVLGGATGGSCITWGPTKELAIYLRQVRKQSRDVSRWARRTLLRDDVPRDLGVPPEELDGQRERERAYWAKRAGLSDGGDGGDERSLAYLRGARLGDEPGPHRLAARRRHRAHSMAESADRSEREEPPA